ncbi:MAG TPA: cell division protein FtsQ/DivIB [Solirubrobacterales bacterium]|nr:cell division protein FtsQ/DivIB [Solirubrobacterales bacterium]
MAVAALLAVLAYWFLIRQDAAEPHVLVPRLAATIGEGEGAIGVASDGSLVRWLPLPEEPPLPRLSLEGPPKRGGKVKGPALEQVRVLAAVPEELRPYIESSSYGEESGVVVTSTTGIELIFGDDSQAAKKWRAAVAVLANPEVTALDYVNLQSPSRPSYGGSEHELPSAP